MYSLGFTVLFLTFLVVSVLLRLWLASRHIRHILKHRNAVPEQFAAKIPLEAHQKAADYTITKVKFGILGLIVNTAVLLGFTVLGGLQELSLVLSAWLGSGMMYQIGLIVAFGVISSVIDLPFDLYKQFVIEEKFGFNRMSLALFFTDMLKSTAVGAVIGLPLLWIVLKLMSSAGDYWWLYAWMVLAAFQLSMQIIYPTLISPIFNKFTPLSDATLRERIEGLMQRVGFSAQGVFVMDGSKRSQHGNAYFVGFGSSRRVVFFDTLIERLAPSEIEAVLAHELGHFKLKHITRGMIVGMVMMLIFFGILGYLKSQVWFYTGLGVLPLLNGGNDAMALLLFMLVVPVFTFLLGPVMSIMSRKHEFEADAFAAKHASAKELVSGLVKMYEDNASTLTPDPVHSAFYDSHPHASIRINRLLAQ